MGFDIKIIECTAKVNDEKKWAQFVFNHPLGNVFQSPEYFQVFKEIQNFQSNAIIAIENDEIIGSLVYIIQKEAKGILGILSSRSIIMGGPLVLNNDLDVLNALLNEYKKQIKGKAIYSQFRNLFDFSFAIEIFSKNGFEYERHLDILIDITNSPDVLKSKISKNKRGNISKSLNKGALFLEVTDKEQFFRCIQLINKTYSRIGLPCPSDNYFLRFFDELYEKGILKVFALKVDDKIVGTRLELCYKDTVYDWWAGADDDFKSYYPNDVIPFHILVWGHENGYKTFDFGGAGKPDIPYGVRDHKMKFGGELVEFGRFELVHKKLLMNLGKSGLVVYKKLKQYVGSKG